MAHVPSSPAGPARPVGYTIEQAARLTGVTRRQIEYWVKTDLVRQTVQVDGWKRRLFSFFDLVELRTVARLRDDGRISLQRVRRVVRELEKVRDRPLRQCTLLTDGATVYYVAEESGAVIDVLSSWQTVIAVSLDGVEWELRRELAEQGLPVPPVLTLAEHTQAA